MNGQIGIAVGLATNIPPHHLGEAIDACLLVLGNAAATLDDVLRVLPGPDLPTSGVIHGRAGIRQAYQTGKGAIRVSGEASVETFKGNRQRIVVTQLPYLVVKQAFVEKLAELVEDAKIDGIADIRDESSDKVGIRVAIDLRKDVDPAVVLNHLREKTDFVRNFNVNMTCLDSRGRPRQMGVLQILGEFVQFRREVVRRRTLHRLEKARSISTGRSASTPRPCGSTRSSPRSEPRAIPTSPAKHSSEWSSRRGAGSPSSCRRSIPTSRSARPSACPTSRPVASSRCASRA